MITQDSRLESSVMVMVNCFAFCNPESNPGPEPFAAAKCVQGAANDDCVTECGRGELNDRFKGTSKKTGIKDD
jgi:hypothetical protein